MRVAPSSIAKAKSPLIPIDSTSNPKSRMRRRPTIPPLPQAAKACARHILCHAPQRNRHQPERLQMLQIRQRSSSGLHRPTPAPVRLWSLQDSALPRSERGAFAQSSGGFVQTLRKPQRIHGVHAVKQLRRPRRLIRLQMADQMHTNRLSASPLPQPVQLRSFAAKLLHAVLAKQQQPQRSGLSHRSRRIGLRYSHQFDFAALPPACRHAAAICLFQPFQIFVSAVILLPLRPQS